MGRTGLSGPSVRRGRTQFGSENKSRHVSRRLHKSVFRFCKTHTISLCISATILFSIVILNASNFQRGHSLFQIGFSKVDITPKEPVWLSGFASRTHPPNATNANSLFARAVSLRVRGGDPFVIVALDVIGLDHNTSARIHDLALDEFNLSSSRLRLVVSHTHSGPVVGRNLYPLVPDDQTEHAKIHRYVDFLEQCVLVAIADALQNVQPSQLRFAKGHAELAVNRRQVPEATYNGTRGETDDAVPVIWVKSRGKVVGGIWGYAAHATVLTNSYKYSGDYPGAVSASLERTYTGSTWLYLPGCGGDQNIYPRGNDELLERHAELLASAVVSVVRNGARRQPNVLRYGGTLVNVEFEERHRRATLFRMQRSSNQVEVRAAKGLEKELDEQGYTKRNYPYPVSAVRIGRAVLAFLGGEPTVRFTPLVMAVGVDWVVAYTDDVMGYIATMKDRKEGGREGSKRAAIYYGLPSTWESSTEERIVDGVQTVLREMG